MGVAVFVDKVADRLPKTIARNSSAVMFPPPTPDVEFRPSKDVGGIEVTRDSSIMSRSDVLVLLGWLYIRQTLDDKLDLKLLSRSGDKVSFKLDVFPMQSPFLYSVADPSSAEWNS